MQSSRGRRHGCFTRENILTRRANQRHYFTIAQFLKPPMALPNGLFGAMAGKKSRQLKLHRLATANDRLRVAVPRASFIERPITGQRAQYVSNLRKTA
jgi:hypothetical protein